MLVEIATFILGISLASERLIELLKTLIPWLAVQHSKTEENTENSRSEKTRRIIIQLISLVTGWVTAAFIAAKDGDLLDLWDGQIRFGTNTYVHVFILGIFSSAGSVFWTQILGYSKALKDVKKQEAQEERMAVQSFKTQQARINKFQAKLKEMIKQGSPEFDQVLA